MTPDDATAEMKIKAIAPWFGGKRNLAPAIVAELGQHVAFWDVFCGSLAVLMAKEPSSFETVNDLHGDLINLARVLAGEQSARELWRRLDRLLMHETVFHEAAARWHERGHSPAGDPGDVSRAEDFMVCSWFGRNGVAGTALYNQGFCVRYTKSGGHAAKRWCSAVDSIPAWHERLRTVTILNRCAFALLERIEDADGVAMYCDPPYVEKGAKYIHDFGDTCKGCGRVHGHEELAGLLRRFKKTRVVVSYYEHPDVRRLYAGWPAVEINVSKAMASQGKRDKANDVRAVELLLINGESLTAGGGLFPR